MYIATEAIVMLVDGLRGHSEDNLRQINTFYIDFDITSAAEEMTTGDI